MRDLEEIRVREEPLIPKEDWDGYVLSRDTSLCYHLSAWMRSVAKAYGHRCHWVVARRESRLGTVEEGQGNICGVLPLVHIRHFILGDSFVSLPYADLGGIVADDPAVEAELLRFAATLQARNGAAVVELRSIGKIASAQAAQEPGVPAPAWKVLMVRDLPGDPDRLFQEFKPKLRSQIRKPEKEGMRFRLGDTTLLDDFYEVFCTNMRDLGSPVHSKDWFRAIAGEYGPMSRLGVVYREEEPVAAGLVLACRNTLSIPWASSVRKYNALSPNMLLYWNFLKYGCENGFGMFDFGRCTPGSGTHRFKEQWGAVATPIRRVTIGRGVRQESRGNSGDLSAEGKFTRELALRVWKRLPLDMANYLGPKIRKYISL